MILKREPRDDKLLIGSLKDIDKVLFMSSYG